MGARTLAAKREEKQPCRELTMTPSGHAARLAESSASASDLNHRQITIRRQADSTVPSDFGDGISERGVMRIQPRAASQL